MEVCPHDDRKKHAFGLCRTCYERHLRKTNPKYREINSRKRKAWKKRNPEKHKYYINVYKARRRERLGATANNATLKYHITYEQYLALIAQAGGVCAICERPARLFIDHDHSTGDVRGMLCNGCNSGLGMLGDNVKGVMAAVRYLETPPGTSLRALNS